MSPRMKIKNVLEIRGADQELRKYLKDLLTITNPKWLEAQTFGRWTGNIPKNIFQFHEEGSALIVPRGILGHLLEDLGLSWEIEDHRVSPSAEWPKGQVILRPEDQELAVSDVLKKDNGFLVAPAGSGKTIMGFELARRLGQKTLWLIHQNVLKDQSVDEAVEHFGFRKKDIGVLHGKRWKAGEVLTIGMIPTLRKRDLADIVQEFGTVIIDEAHHAPSASFLGVITEFYARNIYGLTATAYRRDKLDSVMFNSIGPKLAEIEHFELFEDERLMIPTIVQRETGWSPPKAHLMDYQQFMDEMPKNEKRNNLIVEDVIRECRPGNYCIILVERTKHAEILTEILQGRRIRAEFAVASVDRDGEERDARGRKKKKAIPKKVREKIISDFKEGSLQVLVTTYDLLMEGFNFKPLNRLFMATPIRWKGNVVQALGRIQRPADNKDDAKAYEYIDEEIGMFVRQADSRFFSVYRPMGMKVVKG